MTSKVKSRKKVIRFTPENEDKIQRLADLNGVTFTAMVNMLLAQSLKDPKLVTEQRGEMKWQKKQKKN